MQIKKYFNGFVCGGFLVCLCLGFLVGFFIRQPEQQTTYIGSGENTELVETYDREYRRHREDQRQSEQYKKEIIDHIRNEQNLQAELERWCNHTMANEKNSLSIIVSTTQERNAVDRIRDRCMEAIRIIDSFDQQK